MSPTRRTLLGLAVGLAGAGTVGCSRNPSASGEIGFAQGDGTFTLVPIDKRKPATVLTGKDLHGKPLSSEHKGKVVVLNVWGSWCGPCRKEAPELVKAAKQTAGKAQFLGINTRDQSEQAALAFCREFGITYPNFWDPEGELLLNFSELPPKAIPSTLVVDPQGRVAARVLGETGASTLVGIVEDLADGK